MKGKTTERIRQQAIQEILVRYGSIDRIDICCLAVRFHVGVGVIKEDIRCAGEVLNQRAAEQARQAALERERKAELEQAKRILRGGGAGV
jgi:hypothetical protein